MIQAIVCTSNTGSTARYASLLADETGLPVYSSREAKKTLSSHSEIIYLGWIMASGIQGYKEAAKQYNICAVCAVGMGKTGTQQEEIREKNRIPDKIPLFTLQGNFDLKKLRGIYKLMMKLMVKSTSKALAEKSGRTPEEDKLLHTMLHGGEHVHLENLNSVLDWYRKQA